MEDRMPKVAGNLNEREMDGGGEKKDAVSTNYHSSSSNSSNWRFEDANLTTQPLGLSPTDKSITQCKGDLTATSASSSVSLGDSFCPVLWGHPNSQQLGFGENNVPTSSCASEQEMIRKGFPFTARGAFDKSHGVGWNPLNSISRGGLFQQGGSGIVPQSLAQFPADSAFIERAARLSCFNGGNFSDMVNPFNISASLNPYLKGPGPILGPQEVPPATSLRPFLGTPLQNDEPNVAGSGRDVSMSVDHEMMDGSRNKNDKEKGSSSCPPDEAKQGTRACSNESEEAEFSGSGGQGDLPEPINAGGEPSPAKSSGAKKRKRTSQTVEQDKGAYRSPSEAGKGDNCKDVIDQDPVSGPGKGAEKPGKDSSQASDGPKEEYIHVRARRGQATNSHSLAERVRREKISERMKFLQDLVPGCSKVTGKAVMLDEIINYVQSLQRQVEFLSMKLATVNPMLDFNIDGILAKEILHSRGGPSSLGFSPDLAMAHNQLHQPQQVLIQAGISGLGTTSEALRTTINSQLTPMTGAFKELPPQLHNAWDEELHNVVHMNFGAAPLNSQESQDLNGSLPPGHMKVEM